MSYFFAGLGHFVVAVIWACALGYVTRGEPTWWLWRLEFSIPFLVSTSALFWIPDSYARRGLMKFLHYPLPDWDVLLLSPASHRHWLFHSAVVPAGCALLFWQYPLLLRPELPFRWITVGLSCGLGCHLFWDCAGSRHHKIVLFPHCWHMKASRSRLWLLSGAAIATLIGLKLAMPI